MAFEVKIKENHRFRDLYLDDPCSICNNVMVYTGGKYIAFIGEVSSENESTICKHCLASGPEGIKEIAKERMQEMQWKYERIKAEMEFFKKIASSDIVFPWDEKEKFAKCSCYMDEAEKNGISGSSRETIMKVFIENQLRKQSIECSDYVEDDEE